MHTPWIFNPLRERLAARGIASLAVQLPSSNPDSAAAQGLTEDVAVVRAEIEAGEGPVVLAAHSCGGVPATRVAARRDRHPHRMGHRGHPYVREVARGGGVVGLPAVVGTTPAVEGLVPHANGRQ
ncbi:alpha/beta fold hydrolase [Streptomyces sp. NPDC006655]|uniref:alpha/beta fold hydrolase n=1 Tax=Streptomyces sp. NPDC006655 TaxID=3156898 RepID=UPI0034552B77